MNTTLVPSTTSIAPAIFFQPSAAPRYKWQPLVEEFPKYCMSDSFIQIWMNNHKPSDWMPSEDKEERRAWLQQMPYQRMLSVISANSVLDILHILSVATDERFIDNKENDYHLPTRASGALSLFNGPEKINLLIRALCEGLTHETGFKSHILLKCNKAENSPFYSQLDWENTEGVKWALSLSVRSLKKWATVLIPLQDKIDRLERELALSRSSHTI